MDKKPQDYRLRITRLVTGPYRTYLVRKGKTVSYIGADETPLALSNLLYNGQAAEMRFTAEDAPTGDDVALVLRKYLAEQERNLPQTERRTLVEVLS